MKESIKYGGKDSGACVNLTSYWLWHRESNGCLQVLLEKVSEEGWSREMPAREGYDTASMDHGRALCCTHSLE